MPVPLGQLLLSLGSGLMTMITSSVCAVIFSATAPVLSAALFVSPAGVTPVESSRKWCRVESTRRG